MKRRISILRQGTQRLPRVLGVVVALVLGLTLGLPTVLHAQSLTWLGTATGLYGESEAYGISADGSVVVGWASDNNWFRRAFRRTREGEMQNLGTLPGYDISRASAVSADGAVVVGWMEDGNYRRRAFRWTSEGGMQTISTLGVEDSAAYGVSADGSIVVGAAEDVNGRRRAFRWTPATGMQSLGTLGGPQSEAYGVSADGSVVVGVAQDANGRWSAFRWTIAGGMEDLNITFASLLADGSVLGWATAISPDGRYIVGTGWNAATKRTEAFLLDTAPSLSRIRGNIALNNFTGDISQVPVTVELRGDTTRTLTIYPETNGDYTISDVQPGTYDIAFKASHWLRVVVPGVVVSGVEVTGLDVALTNGDVDGDNEVTLFDFGVLVRNFGAIGDD
ncbi:MAG: hypothetical protein HPY54_10030 [Chthonomonadetes bacterium]|nr:hypothetical protein [Chthonomonadetes bacterium]